MNNNIAAFLELLHTPLGQFLIVIHSVLFAVTVTLSILNRSANPHKSRVYTYCSLTLAFFLLLFSISSMFLHTT